MNNVLSAKYRLSALSIFRGILSRSVPQSFMRLLNALDSPPEEFLRRYGEFYSLVSERGCSDRLAYSFTEAALFDENCFTRSAAGGIHHALPEGVLRAVKNDCEAILSAANLQSDEVLRAYAHYDAIQDIAHTLPRWQSGECADSFRMFDGSLDRVAAWYRTNGCGIFARYKAFIWRDGDIRPVTTSRAMSGSVPRSLTTPAPFSTAEPATTACSTATWAPAKAPRSRRWRTSSVRAACASSRCPRSG